MLLYVVGMVKTTSVSIVMASQVVKSVNKGDTSQNIVVIISKVEEIQETKPSLH